MELFQPHIKEKDLAVMCSQFSIILGAGLPVVRAIELIADQTVDKNLKKALVQTAEDVGSGISLARAFERRGTLLPIALIESVRAGEETGTLEASFARLQRYYNKTAHTVLARRGRCCFVVTGRCSRSRWWSAPRCPGPGPSARR